MGSTRALHVSLDPRRGATLLLAFATLACRPGERAAADSASHADSAAGASAAAAPSGARSIAIIRAADWIGTEWSEDAMRVGLQEEGFEEGRDFTFKTSSAQGDPATLPSLMDAAMDAKSAVIVALQDATLHAAVQRVKSTPVVFHVLSDPFAAGAGTSDSSHLANITGVYSPGYGDPEQEQRVALIKRLVPAAKRVGVLFTPGEPLAVTLKDKLTLAGRRNGLTIVSVPVPSVSEAGVAAASLLGQNVDAIEIFGNTAHAGFPAIIKAANDRKVPVFSASPFEMLKGATAAIYPDFADGGIVAGHMIGRILKGESPGSIPFHRVTALKTSVSDEGGKAASDAEGKRQE